MGVLVSFMNILNHIAIFTYPGSAVSSRAHCFTQNLFSHLTEVVIFPVLVLVFADGVLSKRFKVRKLTDRFKDMRFPIPATKKDSSKKGKFVVFMCWFLFH